MSDQKQWIKELFAQYETNLNGHSNHPIANFRKSAFAEFVAADIPTRRDEDWKYTSVAKIFRDSLAEGQSATVTQADVAPYLFDGLDVIQIVYSNGVFCPDISTLGSPEDGLQIVLLSEALEHQPLSEWIAEVSTVEGGTDVNAFLPLNKAFASNGIVITTDKNAVISKPIHIIHLNTQTSADYFTTPQLYIKSETSSQVTVIESHIGNTTNKYFSNIANRIDVADNAQVTHYKLQEEGDEALQVSNTLVRQHRDSTFTSYVVDLGGSMVRNNLSTDLLASGTNTNYYGVYLGTESQHIDNQTYIDHAMPHCESNELYKGILTDKARGVFNGKVMVREDAQKTNAFQQNSSLVLSPTAVMDAKPQLEIYADDVKCSHGATIGQMDESSIFYLRSRGIPEAAARTLLQKAFVGEVIMHVNIPEVRDAILAKIHKKLDKK